MNNRKKYSYPVIDLANYFKDFLSNRKNIFNQSDLLANQDIEDIQNNISKLVNAKINNKHHEPDLNGKLDKIIQLDSFKKADIELVLYLKRYFELHNIVYSKLEMTNGKMNINACPNDINILSKISYLLQKLYLEKNDFNFLSTSIKINDYILDIFSSIEINNSLLTKQLIHHEILILENCYESI